MTEPNEEELLLIEKLRGRLEPLLLLAGPNGTENHDLLRWTRAANHDLQKAEELFTNTLLWRNTNGIDNILQTQWDPYWFLATFPFWVDSVDKLGHPVVELPCGIWNQCLATSNPQLAETYKWYLLFYLEKLMEAVRQQNRLNPHLSWPVTQFSVIADNKGLDPSNILDNKALDIQMWFLKMYETHYPETLYKCYMINVSPLLPLQWAMTKSATSPKTMEKFIVYRDEEEWRPALMEEIGEDNLGHMYGGKKIRMVRDQIFNYDLYIKPTVKED